MTATSASSPDQVAPAASFRWLALFTCAVVYGLIVLGGVVRVTGAGDACPDWPRCHGQLIPPLERDVLIEFSHRLVASVVGFLVLVVAIVPWRMRAETANLGLLRWGGALAVLLVGAQIIVGGATVLNDLDSDLVTAHLALASSLLATVLVIALVSIPGAVSEGADRAMRASFRNLALISALAVFALMLSGSYVAGSGSSLAFRDWPLFDGQLLPEGGHRAMAHATHRFAAAAVGLLLIYLAARAWREGHSAIARATALAMALYIAQVFVGAANVWTLIQPAAQASHLALAVAVWATLVTLVVLAWRGAGGAQGAPAARSRVREATPVALSRSREPAEAAPAGPSS